MKTIRTIAILFLLSVTVHAQDFGMDVTTLSDFRSLGAGMMMQHFQPSSGNPTAPADRIDFSTSVPMIELRQDGGRLSVGWNGFTDARGSARRSLSVYGETHNDLPLGLKLGTMPTLFLPVIVSANYVRADAPSATVGPFDIGSVGIGTGLKFKRFGRDWGVTTFAAASLLYATRGFSTEYGSQTSLAGEITVIRNGWGLEGVLAGYRFERQVWNMNDARLDYRRLYHLLFIGFLF